MDETVSFTSYGAAGEVTGSKHLIETENGSRILLDCGLFQGRREEAAQKNSSFGFDARSIDAVILSHAHVDHSGLLPKLVKEGFTGPIYSTVGTFELSGPMLLDCARIQQEDEQFIKKHHIASPVKSAGPLYTEQDVNKTLQHFVGKEYEETFTITDDVSATFFDAGHVFGSAITVLMIKTAHGKKELVFTGDLGRNNIPIIRDPTMIANADYLVIESTYGDRQHERIHEIDHDLQAIITQTIKRGGKIFIPAFALERTQEIVLRLEDLIHQKKIPKLPIFVDSPLATKLSKVFEQHPEYYDDDLKARCKTKRKIFSFDNLRYTQTVDESKGLNSLTFPCIIIAGSGMMENGRIRHHIKNNIEDARSSFLIVGYQAENTLGRKLMEGRKAISLFNNDYKVNAEIYVLKSLSAHADQNDLDNYIRHMKGLKKIFLVHGEKGSRENMEKRISAFHSGAEIILPERGVKYEL